MLTKPPLYGDKRYVYHINYNRAKLMSLIQLLKEKHPVAIVLPKK